jgi:ribosomal protein S18 acetylase RimI-like enzyme
VARACGWSDNKRDEDARSRLYRAVGLDDSELAHWVAYDGDRPVGMASSWLQGSVVDLCNLAVMESYRRQGIGRELALVRIRAAHEAGATSIVAALSLDGWELYRTLGFESVPVIPNRWFYLPMTR